ncbi:uncharacterized protein dbf4b [Siniperca chuatsi]|uniref:uncharacterized protein dbf4b n=1 Tax=Siniperca chuatsi TaxID=119488 RepID=UPI001CE0FFAF|nr:uncharacterized protein dbf4b [Siniperca chuatsi]XP_044033564.1 uncharacterized protein dbf4b [Siniperca chuatsi]
MQHQQYAEERGLLGSLCPGQKKLEGKTFYLDSVKKRATALLLETISLLGGVVESFLHKDVSFVVTGSQECLKDLKCTDTKAGAKGTSEEAQRPIMTRESLLSNDKQRPGTSRPVACGSRGKALLEKAIRNNERLQRSSVLANARSWGVKILYVDDVLLYLKQLTRESFCAIHKRPERTYTKQQGAHLVKAAALRSPYLKIEDLSRKYKPLHMQSVTFPTLWYSGRFSPFESPPPRFEKQTEQGEIKTREKKKVESSIQDKSQTPLSCNPSPWRPRKKDLSYCECCHQPFTNLEEHLQSDQHRAFVLDLSNYSAVDQLVAEMLPGFNPNPPQQSEETLNRPPTPLPIQDVCELEPLTDVEMEHAVQALQRQGSSSFIAHISSPTSGSLSSGPASPSPGLQFPIPSPATPPADIQPFITNPDCQLPDSHRRASSPAMPVLDAEPQAHDPVSQQPDTQHLSPCPDTQCPSPDPYSLPPVLSPQVPYHSYIMELYCSNSEPPVLSPQRYTAEEAVEGHTCEMDTAESVSQSVPAVTLPISTQLLPSVALTNAEGVKGSNQESLSGFNGLTCSTNGFECAALYSRRSRSLPRQSATAPNPKKRCRSASPEHSRSKRRRITVKFGYSGSWTEQGHKSPKPESDIMAKPEGCLLFDKVSSHILDSCPNPKVSSTCTVETLDLKQTFTVFCVPTIQNFTQAPNQMDILSNGSTSVADQPSWPLSSKAKIFDPPLEFANDKSHSAFSSQDSQRSLSHSTSVCIESALIPDLAMISPSSSDSDWDCELLSRLGPTSAAPLSPTEQSCELDKELLHRPCIWMHNTSYESRLHTVLQPSTPATSLCGEEMDPSVFSRNVVQVVEVQH